MADKMDIGLFRSMVLSNEFQDISKMNYINWYILITMIFINYLSNAITLTLI